MPLGSSHYFLYSEAIMYSNRISNILVWILSILLFTGCGGGGGKAIPPPSPAPLPLVAPGNLQAKAVSEGNLLISWNRYFAQFDGFELEGRIKDQTFSKLHAGLIPVGVEGIYLTIDPSIAEMTPFEFRLRAMRSTEAGPYSNAFRIVNPLHQPVGVNLHAGFDTNNLNWSNNSLLAEEIRIERAIGTSPNRVWTVIGSVPVTSRQEFTDDTYPDGDVISYRLTAISKGVESVPVECSTPYATLRSPTALTVKPIPGGARLTWVNRSVRSPTIRIRRSPGLGMDYFATETVATLAPGTTSTDDLMLPIGIYTYQVFADLGDDHAWSFPCSFVTPPASTTSMFNVELIQIHGSTQSGDIQGDPAQGWWLATSAFREINSPVAVNLIAGNPHSSAIDLLKKGSNDYSYGSSKVVLSKSEPHVFGNVFCDGQKTELRHEWKSSEGWVSEAILTKDYPYQFQSLQAGIGLDNELHLIWFSVTEGVQHAVKKDGTWQIETIVPPAPGIDSRTLRFASSADGTLQVCLRLWVDQSEKLRLFKCSPQGVWSWEDVPMPPRIPDAQMVDVRGISCDEGSVRILIETPSEDPHGADNRAMWALSKIGQNWFSPEHIISLSSLGYERYVDFAIRGNQSAVCLDKADGLWLYLKNGDTDWVGIKLAFGGGRRIGFDSTGNPWILGSAGTINNFGNSDELLVLHRVLGQP